MKNNKGLIIFIIVVVFCLFMSQIQAQDKETRDKDRIIASLSADPKLLAVGGYPDDEDDTNDMSVLHIHFDMRTSRGDNNEIGAYFSYANLQPYKYFDMGFLYSRNIRIFKSYKWETLAGASFGLIVRNEYPGYETQKMYFDYGVNLEIRYWVAPWLALFLDIDTSPRNDLNFYPVGHQEIHVNGKGGVKIIVFK